MKIKTWNVERRHFGNSSDEDSEVEETPNASNAHKKRLERLAREDDTNFSHI